ncbi:hypothetical protein Ancab_028158, partial [Ancistrocladus abbreviatus]
MNSASTIDASTVGSESTIEKGLGGVQEPEISGSGKKRSRSSTSGEKHPTYRGIRMRNWGKWRPVYTSPKDIQAAVAKA